jgi:hypothetical protein
MHMALGAEVNSLVKTCLGGSWEAPKTKPESARMPAFGAQLEPLPVWSCI